jgi:hypothetical protein
MRNVASTNVMITNTTLRTINSAKILLGWIECDKSDPIGTSNSAQARREIAALLPSWFGFLAGIVLGTTAYVAVGLPCILLAILPVGSLTLWYVHLA